ncbi:MAG: ABC transporter ATP-binding protein [Anaerolineales bacterium]
MPLLVEDLTCRYLARKDPAIKDVSFSIEAGQIALIAGESGCGKTTLLRCINGLIPRSYKADLSGQILLNGEDYADRSLAELSQVIGTVLQDPERQILGAYVRNEVAFGLENLGVPRDEIVSRIEEALEYLGLFHLQSRETFSLSGGEKQKLALAGVMIMRPAILALDEPLANLDPASAREALALLRRLADEGKTVLIVEHRVEDVLAIDPDIVMYMEQGQVTYLGSADGLLKVADYRAVKLPAHVVITRAKDEVSPRQIRTRPSLSTEARDLVEFKDVSFNYSGGPTVVRDVSLSIREGDIIALLGSNGAGKTTLVKHAVGLLRPVKGQVIFGRSDSKEMTVAEMARIVGFVFQSPRHMLFAPTVQEELAFGPTNLGHAAGEIDLNTELALAAVNLSGEAERPPLALSFGQQKRVSIAAILAMRSAILVMDEPTAGQDFANYMSIMDSVVGLSGADGQSYSFSAIVFITHDLDLALTYANRVLLMSDGEIIKDGSPEEVLSDHEALRHCRVRPTSLLEANLKHLGETGGFMRAESLAYALGD